MSNDKMRAEFEAWLFEYLNNADMEDITKARAEQDGQSIYLFEDDDEATMCITAMWVAWQASRAALAIEMPEEYDDEWLNTDEVRQAIEYDGVRVKP